MFFKKILTLDGRAWIATALNAVAMGFQLFALLKAGPEATKGISLITMAIFLYGQITFAQIGKRDSVPHLKWGMIASALITTVIVGYCIWHRF